MNELTYTRVGNYNLPDLRLPEQETHSIGKYGVLRKSYLKTHRKIICTNLLTSGRLHNHLVEIDQQAREMLESLMQQMAAAQGVTEELKMQSQLDWVGKMNNIKARAEEVILREIIYLCSFTP